MARALCLVLATLLSLTLAWATEQVWSEPLRVTLLFLALAAVGRLWLGGRSPSLWRKLFGGTLAAIWLAATAGGLLQELSTLERLGTAGLELVLAYLWRLSLALGLIGLVWREDDPRFLLPYSLLAPLGFGGLLLRHPRADWLFLLPLLTALGFFPGTDRMIRQDWAWVGAEILEMASLQVVAWTVVLTFANPLPELAASRFFDAAMTFFGTAIFGWLFSGLLWGGAASLRAQERDPGL